MRTLFRRAAGCTRFFHTGPTLPAPFAGITGLCNPKDWFTLAGDAARRCDELVLRAIEEPPSVQTVQTLDDISDALCQVLDAAEFCRNAHVDPEWRAAAQQVCMDLGGYVHHLNTHYALYTALDKALAGHYAAEAAAAAGSSSRSNSVGDLEADCSTTTTSSSSSGGGGGDDDGWSSEAVLVARMFKRDFEQYGVHLSGQSRERMTHLVQRAQELGMRITHNIVTPDRLGAITLERSAAGALQSLPPHLQRAFRPLADKRSGHIQGVSAPADTSLLSNMLRMCHGEEARKQAFLASQQLPEENVRLLDELVEARHEMAGLMGFSSYAHYKLDGVTLANRPDAVQPFLEHLGAAIRPKCLQEMSMLEATKRELGGGGPLRPWDRSFLMGIVKGRESAQGVDLSRLPQYFQLERVVEGLSTLLRRLMGVSLVEQPMEPGEGWAPGVRKLAAVHDSEGLLGTVYLDLYQRPSKFPGAAHFTLRCGRRAADGSYQAPVLALLAGLAPNADMSHSEVETLFHEFGHAIHSLLSRTRFQHLAGTRGPLDTVEIPSHVMEPFAIDPRVLALFARHRSTGEPLPRRVIDALRDSRRLFAGLDQELQLVYCAVDQLLHGPSPPTGQRAQEAVGEIVQRFNSFGYCPGTWPHLRFNHVVGYGATYYSYLYAQCLSANIWQARFAADPLSRGAGEALRHNLLEAGGAKEAHAMVEEVLGSRTAMHEWRGGWFPDAHSMLQQQGLLMCAA